MSFIGRVNATAESSTAPAQEENQELNLLDLPNELLLRIFSNLVPKDGSSSEGLRSVYLSCKRLHLVGNDALTKAINRWLREFTRYPEIHLKFYKKLNIDPLQFARELATGQIKAVTPKEHAALSFGERRLLKTYDDMLLNRSLPSIQTAMQFNNSLPVQNRYTTHYGEYPRVGLERFHENNLREQATNNALEDPAFRKIMTTELIYAALSNQAHVIELIKEYLPDIVTDLSWHAMCGSVKYLRHTITMSNGVNAEEPTPTGMTPLHWAVVRGDESIVLGLLEAGADPHKGCTVPLGSYSDEKLTPLTLAVELGNFEILKTLASFSSGNIDKPINNPNIDNALQLAIKKLDYKIIRFLLQELKANPNGGMRASPLKTLINGMHGTIAYSYPFREQILDLLIDAGLDLNQLHQFNGSPVARTCLHHCTNQNIMPFALILLERGANPNIPDTEGRFPIEFQINEVTNTYTGMGRLLLTNGARSNIELRLFTLACFVVVSLEIADRYLDPNNYTRTTIGLITFLLLSLLIAFRYSHSSRARISTAVARIFPYEPRHN